MSIGERIRYFRRLKGLTQRELGMALGFPRGSADVRLAQYETGTRSPKGELTLELARVLEVSPRALTVPATDSPVGLMHTLLSLEDLYGLRPRLIDGKPVLTLEGPGASENLTAMLAAWAELAGELDRGSVSHQDYDRWRYRYPELTEAVPPKGGRD